MNIKYKVMCFTKEPYGSQRISIVLNHANCHLVDQLAINMLIAWISSADRYNHEVTYENLK